MKFSSRSWIPPLCAGLAFIGLAFAWPPSSWSAPAPGPASAAASAPAVSKTETPPAEPEKSASGQDNPAPGGEASSPEPASLRRRLWERERPAFGSEGRRPWGAGVLDGSFAQTRAQRAILGVWTLVGILLTGMGLGLGLAAWGQVLRAAAPRTLDALRETFRARPMLCMGVGLLAGAAALALWRHALMGRPLSSIPFWILISGATASGMAAQIEWLGRKLMGPCEDPAERPALAFWRGAAAMIPVFFIPFLGQFLFVMSIAAGLGAAILAFLFVRRKES